MSNIMINEQLIDSTIVHLNALKQNNSSGDSDNLWKTNLKESIIDLDYELTDARALYEDMKVMQLSIGMVEAEGYIRGLTRAKGIINDYLNYVE